MPIANRVTATRACAAIAFCMAIPAAVVLNAFAANRQAVNSQSLRDASRLSSIQVILPPRLVAGAPATLATVGADHRLVGHVRVELNNGPPIETDATGRANFTAPGGAVLIARAGGGSAATLIDPPVAGAPADVPLRAPRFAALHNSLNLCGGGFDGNAEANRVELNGEPALVVAASPECLVVIPGVKAAPGAARIVADRLNHPAKASVTLIALDFEPPNPSLTPGQKGWLTVRARGSNRKLRIEVGNESPDVLRFAKGDTQEVVTSGGEQNIARIGVQAIRSGDFSFHARIVPPADAQAARRFLQAAEPLATADAARRLRKVEGHLARHPKQAETLRAELDRLVQASSPGDLRTLLAAARSAL